jgi:hypothetical protein
MKKDTLILLGLVGIGLYLYYRNKKQAATTPVERIKATAVNPNSPENNTGVVDIDKTGAPILQTLDARGNVIENQVQAHFSLSGYKKLGSIPNTI